MDSAIKKEIAVEWKCGPLKGQVRVSDGRLLAMEVVSGCGTVDRDRNSSTEQKPFRLKISLEGVSRRYTQNPTIVSIVAGDRSLFSSSCATWTAISQFSFPSMAWQ